MRKFSTLVLVGLGVAGVTASVSAQDLQSGMSSSNQAFSQGLSGGSQASVQLGARRGVGGEFTSGGMSAMSVGGSAQFSNSAAATPLGRGGAVAPAIQSRNTDSVALSASDFSANVSAIQSSESSLARPTDSSATPARGLGQMSSVGSAMRAFSNENPAEGGRKLRP
jgi:hypothetical protein